MNYSDTKMGVVIPIVNGCLSEMVLISDKCSNSNWRLI